MCSTRQRLHEAREWKSAAGVLKPSPVEKRRVIWTRPFGSRVMTAEAGMTVAGPLVSADQRPWPALMLFPSNLIVHIRAEVAAKNGCRAGSPVSVWEQDCRADEANPNGL